MPVCGAWRARRRTPPLQVLLALGSIPKRPVPVDQSVPRRVSLWTKYVTSNVPCMRGGNARCTDRFVLARRGSCADPHPSDPTAMTCRFSSRSLLGTDAGPAASSVSTICSAAPFSFDRDLGPRAPPSVEEGIERRDSVDERCPHPPPPLRPVTLRALVIRLHRTDQERPPYTALLARPTLEHLPPDVEGRRVVKPSLPPASGPARREAFIESRIVPGVGIPAREEAPAGP